MIPEIDSLPELSWVSDDASRPAYTCESADVFRLNKSTNQKPDIDRIAPPLACHLSAVIFVISLFSSSRFSTSCNVMSHTYTIDYLLCRQVFKFTCQVGILTVSNKTGRRTPKINLLTSESSINIFVTYNVRIAYRTVTTRYQLWPTSAKKIQIIYHI